VVTLRVDYSFEFILCLDTGEEDIELLTEIKKAIS
jgi:hypothetical protein